MSFISYRLLLTILFISFVPTILKAIQTTHQAKVLEQERCNNQHYIKMPDEVVAHRLFWKNRIMVKQFKRMTKNSMIKQLRKPSNEDEILFNWNDTRIRIGVYLLVGGLLVRALQISLLGWIGYLAIALGIGILLWAMFDPKGIIRSHFINRN